MYEDTYEDDEVTVSELPVYRLLSTDTGLDDQFFRDNSTSNTDPNTYGASYGGSYGAGAGSEATSYYYSSSSTSSTEAAQSSQTMVDTM